MVLEAAFRWSKKKTDTVHANVLTAYELHQVNSDSISLFWGRGGGGGGEEWEEIVYKIVVVFSSTN